MLIKTGYYDWNNVGLNDSFYPDDIPEEWRLSFYANEIECAQVNLAELGDGEDAEELFDDLPESFDLILTCDDLKQWDLLEQLLDNDDVNVKTVVVNEACFNEWSDELKKRQVTYFALADKFEDSFETGVKVEGFNSDQINIVYIDTDQDLKKWKKSIQCWVDKDSDNEYFFLLNASLFQSSKAGELRMLIDMMGY